MAHPASSSARLRAAEVGRLGLTVVVGAYLARFDDPRADLQPTHHRMRFDWGDGGELSETHLTAVQVSDAVLDQRAAVHIDDADDSHHAAANGAPKRCTLGRLARRRMTAGQPVRPA